MTTHHGRPSTPQDGKLIVRILGEGQLALPKDALGDLNELDLVLMAAITTGDEAKFQEAMNALIGKVRALGEPIPVEEIRPSDLILPGTDSSLDEVRDLLSEDGLIPG